MKITQIKYWLPLVIGVLFAIGLCLPFHFSRSVEELNVHNFNEKVLQSEVPVIVDFYGSLVSAL